MDTKSLVISKKDLIVSIVVSLFAMVMLGTSLTTISHALPAFLTEEAVGYTPAFTTFGICVISYAGKQLFLFFFNKVKPIKIYQLVTSIIALGLGITTLFVHSFPQIFLIDSITIFSFYVVYQILVLIFVIKKKRDFVLPVIVIALMLMVILVLAVGHREIFASIVVSCIIISAIALGTIIVEAFAKIHFTTIRKIIRKTYTIEILLGLVFLIVSFSFVFSTFEEMSYLDALWYCFAIVTTIGFGDVVVTGLVSRILSVILGIYGIIVVALITSIIVNFYNETKLIDKKDETKKQEQEPKEEDKEDSKKE